MQNSTRLFTLTIFVFSSLAALVYQGRADNLRDILQSASQMPSLLRSYQFSFELRGGASDPRKYQKVDVWQSGSNIKSISTWVFPEGEKMDPLLEPFEYAFNGMDYQWFSTGHVALTFSKKCRHPTPYWTPSPLIWPYDWMMGQQTNWSDIKDLANWNARFKVAKYVGQKVENEMLFEVVSFPDPRRDLGEMNLDKICVYFAKDLNYYPLKMFGYKDGLNKGLPLVEGQVTQYKTFDIDEMLFVFPLRVEVRDGAEGDGLSEEPFEMYWTVDESSIKINPQLDDDMFTISPSRAKTVTDYDRMLESGAWLPSDDVADDGRSIVPEPLPTATWTTQKIISFIVINLIILGLLVYAFLRRRK